MQRPNFLFVITDQHRHDHLGCAGNQILKTPNIDGLARTGTQFENFYVASAICMPNRASIMTGRMPSLHGVRFNGIPLSRDAVTFVDLLRSAGYETALIGKSHLQNFTEREATYKGEQGLAGDPPPTALTEARRTHLSGPDYEQERIPRETRAGYSSLATPFYGFDHVELCTLHGDRVHGHYAEWLESNHEDARALRSRKNLIPDDRYTAPQAFRTRVPESLYSTAYVGSRTEAFLESHAARNDDAPFFVQCSFPDPHHPYTPPGRYWDLYDPAEIPLPEAYHQKDLPPTVEYVHERSGQHGFDRAGLLPFRTSERETQEIIALTYGMITNVDDAIGRIISTLERLGLAENTVIVFTSDHGDFMGDRQIMLKGPLHYQGIAKVPFIWRDPTQTRQGERVSALGCSLDISRTILSRAGLAPFNGMQGKDLQPLIDGSDHTIRESLLIEQDTQNGNFGFNGPIRARTLVTERWRLSTYQGAEFAELYDLTTDPFEMENQWGHSRHQSELLRAMVDEMTALQEVSPLPTMYA